MIAPKAKAVVIDKKAPGMDAVVYRKPMPKPKKIGKAPFNKGGKTYYPRTKK